MTIEDKNNKSPIISKKWLYGSLAVIALLLGIFLDKEAIATPFIYDITQQQVKISIKS